MANSTSRRGRKGLLGGTLRRLFFNWFFLTTHPPALRAVTIPGPFGNQFFSGRSS
jgi:hypothetical protein